jgi:hypothetical protein
MPPTAVLRETLAASLIGRDETETSFRLPQRRKETPMSATLTAAQLGRACLPELFSEELRAAFRSPR